MRELLYLTRPGIGAKYYDQRLFVCLLRRLRLAESVM